MFGERDVLVKCEQCRDLIHEAEYERFVRQVRIEDAQAGRVRFMESLIRSIRQRAVGAEQSFRLVSRRQG